LFHGRAGHDEGIGYLGSGLPLLSAGSAAVPPEGRAAEIPGQYEVVRVTADGLARWVRRYDPDSRSWAAGNPGGAGTGGDAEQLTRRWHAARQTFPLRVEPKLQELATRWEPAAPEGFDRPPGPQRALLDRVAGAADAQLPTPGRRPIDRAPPHPP